MSRRELVELSGILRGAETRGVMHIARREGQPAWVQRDRLHELFHEGGFGSVAGGRLRSVGERRNLSDCLFQRSLAGASGLIL